MFHRVCRSIVSLKTLCPINGAFPMEGDPFMLPEEGGVIVYGMWNEKTFQGKIGVYEIVNGIPCLAASVPVSGTNGAYCPRREFQPSVNWMVGILERSSTNDLPTGSYYIPVEELEKRIELPKFWKERGNKQQKTFGPEVTRRRELFATLPHRKCVEISKLLLPAREGSTTKLEILQIDEDGAPGALSNFPVKAKKFTHLMTIRLEKSLMFMNTELMTTWHRYIKRAQEVNITHDPDSARMAIQDMAIGLQELLTAHCYRNWITPGSVDFKNEYCERMNNICTKIVSYFPELVKPVDTFNLKLCAVDPTQIPLLIGIQGSPVGVGRADLVDGFKFPRTWRNTPFEAKSKDEKAPFFRKPVQKEAQVIYSSEFAPEPVQVEQPKVEVDPSITSPVETPVKEHATTGGISLKSFWEIPSLE